ncbi:MAG: cupin domain-containing protein [Gammaproteobacteria bacterium]|nr:cupin domain-containing protein [Gammaproteobacteria bacterium]
MADSKYFIERDFVVLSPDKTATIERFDSTLYARLDKDYNGCKGHELISCYEFSQDWPTWEIHPHGDEIVILLSGKVRFVLQLEEGDKSIELVQPGSYVIVPRNIWHTAKTGVKTKMLFITPGEGTRNKDA